MGVAERTVAVAPIISRLLFLIVHDKVVIEIKSVEALVPVHRKQLATYLRLMDLRLGLLLNFNVELMKDGIQRVVNRLAE